MKLSPNTINVLKNFVTINSGIVVKPGKVLKTNTPIKTVFASATVEEEFPREFGISELAKVLGVLSLYENPELDFEDEHLVIKSGRAKTRIRYTEPKLISVIDKSPKLPNVDLEILLDEKDLKLVNNIGAVLKCPHLVFESQDGEVVVSAADVKGEIVDNTSLSLNKKTKESFRFTIKVDNLKLMDGAYTVKLSAKGISEFVNKNVPLTYYIAVESTLSNFGE